MPRYWNNKRPKPQKEDVVCPSWFMGSGRHSQNPDSLGFREKKEQSLISSTTTRKKSLPPSNRRYNLLNSYLSLWDVLMLMLLLSFALLLFHFFFFFFFSFSNPLFYLCSFFISVLIDTSGEGGVKKGKTISADGISSKGKEWVVQIEE